jgi:hypothetical protein
MGWLVSRLGGFRLICYCDCRVLKMLDRTRWIALGDVSRIYHFRGGTSDEDRLGVVSAPYATLFWGRRRHDVKNGTRGAVKSSESVC